MPFEDGHDSCLFEFGAGVGDATVVDVEVDKAVGDFVFLPPFAFEETGVVEVDLAAFEALDFFVFVVVVLVLDVLELEGGDVVDFDVDEMLIFVELEVDEVLVMVEGEVLEIVEEVLDVVLGEVLDDDEEEVELLLEVLDDVAVLAIAELLGAPPTCWLTQPDPEQLGPPTVSVRRTGLGSASRPDSFSAPSGVTSSYAKAYPMRSCQQWLDLGLSYTNLFRRPHTHVRPCCNDWLGLKRNTNSSSSQAACDLQAQS